jgi:DNA recombination protein RmuC
MSLTVVSAALLLAILALAFLAVLYVRARTPLSSIDSAPIIALLTGNTERLDRLVRDEFGRSRDEARSSSGEIRQELAASVAGFGDAVRNEVVQMREHQNTRLSTLVDTLRRVEDVIERRLTEQAAGLTQQHDALTREVVAKHDQMRLEAAENREKQRRELTETLKNLHDSVLARLDAIAASLTENISRLTDSNQHQLARVGQTFEERMTQLTNDLSGKHDSMRTEANDNRRTHREEISARLKDAHETVIRTLTEMQNIQKHQIESFRQEIERLSAANEQRLEAVRSTVDQRLLAIQNNNTEQLESMRNTVDEKLNDTLEKRLGESFRQVSDRLEQVHKGLGEMQMLATGVGDLKKVFANVKMRGGWGEVQLGALLEEMLAPDQFVRNLKTHELSGECVEFAVRLPGKHDDVPVYLPLDAKFPLDDYQRLVNALETGDLENGEAFSRELERRIKSCAKDIHEKYINPPRTTDFAIMFLPVEGLYAEVLRRPILAEAIRRDFHVMLAGPTTLAAILNSLQMGFRTLAIEKRSSEVWQLLAAVKTEFGKFGGALDTVKKGLHRAANKIDLVAVRSRAIERQLRTVETLPEPAASAVLGLAAAEEVADAPVEEWVEAGEVVMPSDDLLLGAR